jgi:drug/metabolite transporter (DMT)-like permease/guanylate kinase
MKKRRAVSAVVASAMLWGTYGSFLTAIEARGMSANVVNFLRFAATSLPILLFLLVKDAGALRVGKKDLWLFAANGLASILFFTACYAAAIRETKIATAAALLYTAPAIVMLLSALLFREKLTRRKCFCVLLSVLGCALVSGLGSGGAALSVRGLLLGLGAGLGYALYSIFSRLIQQRGYSTYTNVCHTFLIAAAAYLLIALFDGTAAQIVRLPGATLLSVVCGLFTGLLAYLLYTAGLLELEPSRAAQLATIEPVFAALLGVLLFAQRLSLTECLGIALVAAAVIGMNLHAADREAAQIPSGGLRKAEGTCYTDQKADCGKEEKLMDPKLIVLCGPSGAGIGEIAAALFAGERGFVPVVPVTARKMKEGEKDGVGFFFFDLEGWNAMKESGDLLETTEFAGNDYGTSRKLVREQLAQGKSVLMEREPARAAQIKQNMPEAVCVYVEPSPAVLEERLRTISRSAMELSLRLETAARLRAESAFCDRYVCSDDVQSAVREIESLLD